jgi:hypothetical protein
VQGAAAFGINQADIANQLNIDEKTLRKHFREELNSGKFKVDMLAAAGNARRACTRSRTRKKAQHGGGCRRKAARTVS